MTPRWLGEFSDSLWLSILKSEQYIVWKKILLEVIALLTEDPSARSGLFSYELLANGALETPKW